MQCRNNSTKQVVGGDIRLTSEALKTAFSEGLMDSGANVIDLGMTGTEEIYFATSHLKADGGIGSNRKPQPDGLQWHETDQRRTKTNIGI